MRTESKLSNTTSLYRNSSVESSSNNLNIIHNILLKVKKDEYTDVMDLFFGNNAINLKIFQLAFPDLLRLFYKKDTSILDKITVDISDLNAKVSIILVKLLRIISSIGINISISLDDIQVIY